MGMTLSEAELNDVDSHYPTDRIPTDMKEKSVAENLLEKMSETQWVLLHFSTNISGIQPPQSEVQVIFCIEILLGVLKMPTITNNG